MPPDSPGSLRRRGPGRPAGGQGGEGRQALLRAARELMAEKGSPRVTVREVAERAGVQPALVNYYFGGKQGLLQAVVSLVAGRLLERVQEGVAQEGSVEERLRSIMQAAVGILADDPYAPRLIAEQVLFGADQVIDDFVERFARRNLETIRGLLEAGRDAGALREVEPMFLVPALFGSCLFFFLAAPIMRRLYDVTEITPELAERFADYVLDVVLHGIATQPETPA
jgi:AcrR family transcriptional regulator